MMTWWQVAQEYEKRHTEQFVAEHGDVIRSRFGMISDDWFDNNATKAELLAWIADKTVVEIGTSVTPQITGLTAKNLILIEPLADSFRDYIPLPDNAVLHACGAEEMLPLAVDGLIMDRNCIDHTTNPMGLLDLICQSALPGCWLTHWSDVWHFAGVDEGHRNITRQPKDIRDFIEARGFKIVHEFTSRFPDYEHGLDYGCLARKR